MSASSSKTASCARRGGGLANIPKMGMIIPEMGTKATPSRGLADALFSRVQQRVLGLLYGQPQRRFQSAELIRLAGSGTGAAHRFLMKLADAGLVTVTRHANQKHYQANPESPIYKDLAGIFRQAASRNITTRHAASRSGTMAETVATRRAEIAALCRRFHVRQLDLFGSAARGTFDPTRSDLDFVVTFENLHPVALADAWFGLREGLAALFGRPVDLLTANSISNPYLRDSIKRTRRVLYAA